MFRSKIANLWTKLRYRVHTAFLAGDFHEFGEGVTICPPFRFANLRYMCIGSRVTINRDCWLVAVESGAAAPGDLRKLVIDTGASIGMGATISAARSVYIGENVLLARNVYISDHGHNFQDINMPIQDQGITEPRPVKIEKNSWLGQNVCILPGVTIGEHCIVGANSVVARDLPAYSVAVGAPASVIKKYDYKEKQWKRCVQPVAKRTSI